MSLLLCRREPVERPYYIEALGIHVYSSQELCYVIFNNPLLVMEEFADDALIDFIRQQLDMAFVAERMKKLLETGCRDEEVLLLFMSECDYYTDQELLSFKSAAASYRKLRPEEYEKQRADYFFYRHQYGKAALRYEKILDLEDEAKPGEAFLSEVYYSLGAAWAQMFQFQKALNAYEKAYSLKPQEDVLKRIYFLGQFSPELEIKGQYRSLFKEGLCEQWNQELSQAKLDGGQAAEVRKLRGLFGQDEAQALSGARALVQKWKQEYRKMV
jgi:tetratricopeptide (TPR) repeat protein